MNRAYVDSSAFLAAGLGEPAAARMALVMRSQETLFTSPLTVAEVASALRREGMPVDGAQRLLATARLWTPSTELARQCEEALDAGRLRGADLWHVVTAMDVAGAARRELLFITLDDAQRDVAGRLGFALPRSLRRA